MFFALPPTYVSSTSISPSIFSKEPTSIILRIRCSMNHAVFCVTFRSRATSQEEIPFLQFKISHMAVSHCPRLSGLFSKMVLYLTPNCLRQPRHFQRLYFSMKVTSRLVQCGHSTPSAHRIATR